MIKLTRLDGREFLLNCDFIEYIEAMPDTMLTLRTEKKIIVKESVNEVLNRIVEYKRSVYSNPFFTNAGKTFINSDTPDLFFLNRNLKQVNDIHDLEEQEDDDN